MSEPKPKPSGPAPPRYVSGLDLGQLSDYSALAVVEVQEGGAMGPDGKPARLHTVRALTRWPLRTPYGQVVEDVVKAFDKAPLTGSALVVDRTGVGVAVSETLAKARPKARIIPATITGGDKGGHSGGVWSVPKRELAGTLQVLLGTRRLQFAKGLALAEVLKKELETFTVKININTGNESFEAWREKDHDDLVLAVALACAWAERQLPPGTWRMEHI